MRQFRQPHEPQQTPLLHRLEPCHIEGSVQSAQDEKPYAGWNPQPIHRTCPSLPLEETAHFWTRVV